MDKAIPMATLGIDTATPMRKVGAVTTVKLARRTHRILHTPLEMTLPTLSRPLMPSNHRMVRRLLNSRDMQLDSRVTELSLKAVATMRRVCEVAAK